MNDKKWNPVELIKTTSEYLESKGVPNAKLDSEILLRHVLGMKSRVELYTSFERPISDEELDKYRALVRRRAEREPVNRILGETEFMGITMMVTPNVLAPRPETEILVEEAVKILNPDRRKKRSEEIFAKISEKEAELERERRIASDSESAIEKVENEPTDKPEPKKSETVSMNPAARIRVLDLCTGSGCIAIAIARMVHNAHVVAADNSAAALSLARENADPHSVWERIDFREGDLFEACWEGETFDMIVSNPPYLVEGDPEIWPEVLKFDPPGALYGGEDGLYFYRRIAGEAGEFLAPGGRLLVEVGQGQAAEVCGMFEAAGFVGIRTAKDHLGIDRVVGCRKAV